jgi:hypothetical protein
MAKLTLCSLMMRRMTKTWNRSEALEDLRPLLSRFLRETASWYPLPSYLEEVLSLPPGDFDRLVASHIALDPRTSEMLEAAEDLTRTLPSSVSRTEEILRGTVRGPVDWSTTMRRRYATGDYTLFACRPPERRYDSPLAHLIARALRECSQLAEATMLSDRGIGEAIWTRSAEAHRLLRHPKIAWLAHARISPLTETTLAAVVRRRPSAEKLVAFLELVKRARYERDPDSVAEVVEQRVLAPSEAGTIFELQVGLAVVDHLRRHGFKRAGSTRIVRSNVPLYRGRHPDGRTAIVWWQKATWSIFPQPSDAILSTTLRGAGMNPEGPYRPDLIVILDPPARRLLVEAKVTEKAQTAQERDGITEMLAYLSDARSVMSGVAPPHGLVVAWNATGHPALSEVMVSDLKNVGRAVDLLLAAIP